jgi:uncharacterized membrane protein YbhN (UPF0104 family)
MPNADVPKKSGGVPAGLLLGFKILFSAGLLWLLFSRIDIGRFWAIASASSIPWLTVALLCYSTTVLGCSWRWYRLLRIQGVKMTFGAVTESMVVSLFFNNFLPTNIGGDVMRIKDTAEPAGSSVRATTVVVLDRVAGLIGLVLVAAVGGALEASGKLPFSVLWIWGALAAGMAAVLVVLLIPNVLDLLLSRLKGTWVGAQLEVLAGTLLNFRADPAGLVESLVVSAFVQVSFILFYSSVAHALGVHVGLADMALIVPAAGIIQMAPVSVNGIGLREAAFTVLFGRVGVPGESALLVSLEAAALILAFSLIGAAAYVVRRRSPERGTDELAIEAVSSQS